MLDSNDGEHPGPSDQIEIPEIVTDPIYIWNNQISNLFLVGDMPKEFYDLWYFCKRQSITQPPEGLIFIIAFFHISFV